MTTITISPNRAAVLRRSIEMSIDMLNDMAIDPMFMTPTQVRELAQQSDETIRAKFQKNSKEVFTNIDQLVELQLLLSELPE